MTILRRCRRYSEDTEGLRERIERRRSLMERMTASYGSTGGGHGGANEDRMAGFVADLEDMEDRLGHRKERYDAERMAAVQILEQLDSREAKVMEMYYIGGYKVAAISEKCGYSDVHVRRLRKQAEGKCAELGDIDGLLPMWYMAEE